nr:hypothetical protein HK105_001870 [Polyrhizophydium stewartii]
MYVMALQAREHWSAWIHHGLGVVGTALERVYRISAVLPVSFIIPEATVPASSAVWLMQRAGADKSHPCWFQAALAVRAVAFLIFRLPVPAIVAARFWAELGVHYARRVRDGAKMLVDAMPESPGVASADSTGISRAALTRLAGPDRTSGSSSSTAASSLPAAATSSPAAHEKRQHAQLTNARIAALLVDDAAHMPRIVSLLLVLNSLAFSVLNVYWSVLVIRAWWRFRPSDVAAAAAAVASVAKTAAAIHHI